MSEQLTHEPNQALPVVELDVQLPENEQLLRQDYEKYGAILNSPEFQDLVVKLDSDTVSYKDDEDTYDADVLLLYSYKNPAELRDNRFYRAAYLHGFWKRLAARDEDFTPEDQDIVMRLWNRSLGATSESQLAFNFRHNLDDAEFVLKGIKHLELEAGEKLRVIEQAKAALIEGGRGEQFEIRSNESLPESPNELTNERAAEAWHLGRLMSGEEKEGVSDEAKEYLSDVKNKIATEVAFVKHQLEGNGYVDDARLLDADEAKRIGMVPFETTISKLVSRYIVQSAGGLEHFLESPSTVDIKELSEAIHKAMDEYLLVYRHDVPLYDKAFDTFDELSKEQVVPEVYLGRDGVYAFYGRKAQQQALKWEVKDGERVRKEDKETVKIAPKYLVFPRAYMNNLSQDAQRAYLEQEGVTKDVDPHFFDTGFKGTIPENILKLMGYDEESLEDHIHLVSSDIAGREVSEMRTIASKRGYHLRHRVMDIEHSPKATTTSEGLYRDGNGKIRPIEVASTPRDQLIFQTVKQGIWRHYWLKNLQNQTRKDNETNHGFGSPM